MIIDGSHGTLTHTKRRLYVDHLCDHGCRQNHRFPSHMTICLRVGGVPDYTTCVDDPVQGEHRDVASTPRHNQTQTSVSVATHIQQTGGMDSRDAHMRSPHAFRGKISVPLGSDSGHGTATPSDSNRSFNTGASTRRGRLTEVLTGPS